MPKLEYESIPLQNQITVRRIENLARLNSTIRYLEVGIFRGETFLALDFPEMTAVDPSPKADTDKIDMTGKIIRAMKSDTYFMTESPINTFDFIFLDGLHTFEQTFRDFCSSLIFSHKKTIWIIDDTVPRDYFSAMPDYQKSMSFRKELGITEKSWHGDVFKTIFAIHDFFPSLDYRTIINNGNPQTVVISSPRPNFIPAWNNLERISRMDYADFIDNRKFMNTSTEEDTLSWARDILKM
jgi:hypothetical protein